VEIVKELGPSNESRVVITIEEIRCVFGGALEESASGVDGDNVAVRLEIVERVEILVLASAWEVGEEIFDAHRLNILGERGGGIDGMQGRER